MRTAATLTAALLALAAAALPQPVLGRATVVNATAGATVKIGMLLPAPVDPYGYSVTASLLEADVNGGIAFPGLLPNHTLEVVVGPTGVDNPMNGFFATDTLVRSHGVAGIVGPVSGGELTSTCAFTSSSMGVNLIGASSSLNALADASLYPFYSRIIGSIEEEAAINIGYLKSLGWNRVGMFVGIEASAVDSLDSYTTAANAAGMQVDQPVQFPLTSVAGGLDTMRPYFNLLKGTGARVILLLVPGAKVLDLIELMRQHGLETGDGEGLTENQYTYVMPSVAAFDTAATGYEKMYAASLGSLFIAPLALDVTDEGTKPWGDRLTQAILGEEWHPSSPVDAYRTRYLYDSALVLLQGVDMLIRHKQACASETPGDSAAPAECQALWLDADEDVSIRRLMRAVPLLNGVTYPVQLDANGERKVSQTAVQFQASPNSTERARAQDSATLDSDLVLVDLLGADGSVVAIEPLVWQDGTGVLPLDSAVVSYTPLLVSDAIYGVMCAMASLAAALCLVCLAGTLAYRNLPIMRMSSYRVNCISIAGGLVSLSFVFLGQEELTPGLCTAKIWLLSVGFSLLFGPMFAKLWRIYAIFGQKKIRSVRVTDWQLFRVVLSLVAVDAGLVGAWNVAAPQEIDSTVLDPEKTSNPNMLVAEVHDICQSDLDQVFYPLLIMLKAALLFYGSFLAHKTRKVEIKALNDSKWIGLSVYTTSLIAMMALPVIFLVGSDNPDASYVLKAGATVIIVAVAMGLLFMPKLVSIWNKTDGEWTVKSSQGGSTATAMTAIGSGADAKNDSPRRNSRRTGGPGGLAASKTGGRGSARISVKTGGILTPAKAGAGPSSEPNSPAMQPQSPAARASPAAEEPGAAEV